MSVHFANVGEDLKDLQQIQQVLSPEETPAEDPLSWSGLDMQNTSVDSGVELAAREAVVEANLGDLEELSNDIEASTIYSLRSDTLEKWAATLRGAINAVRTNLKSVTQNKDHRTSSLTPTAKAHQQHHKERAARAGEGGVGPTGTSSTAGVGSFSGPSTQRSKRLPSMFDISKRHMSETRDLMMKANASSITVGNTVAGSIHLLMESCAAAICADWGSCFIYQTRTEELVLACGVGRRVARPGTQRVPASVGVESHVLATGVAVNIAHAYVEEEFSSTLDKATNTRTKTQLVFPLMKPGTSSVAFGVIEFGNKTTGQSFTAEDETRVAQCGQFAALIITKYPSDITNSNCFDPSIFGSSKETERDRGAGSIVAGLTIPNAPNQQQLVHRTGRVGHLKRSEVMRDATGLSALPSIAEAIGYVTKVNEGWRNAVILNMELEKEIDRLHEALRVSRRETTRLQGALQEARDQNPLVAVTATTERTKDEIVESGKTEKHSTMLKPVAPAGVAGKSVRQLSGMTSV